MNKLLFVIVFIVISAVHVSAQVDFTVDIMSDSVTYQVSLMPSQTWSGSEALTSTAQVTLLVPTGGFLPANLVNINGTWSLNTPFVAPVENPNFDYLTIGLQSLGTPDIEYEAGVETPLFTFQNTGTCTGGIELMEAGDPFEPDNSLNANVGNQITTFGSGNINAWTGNYDPGNASCLRPIDTIDLSLSKTVDMMQAAIADEVTFTITVYNEGPDDANSVSVLDALPDGAIFTGNATASQGAFVDSIWTVGTIAPNDSATLEIVVTAGDAGVFVNKAEVMATSGVDLDSTPNNGISLEDDQDVACFSTPYVLCEGGDDTLKIDGPAGFASYQWYKDSVAIDGADGGTAMTYFIVDAGAYHLAVEDAVLGDCGNQMCCPILVEVGDCCPANQCIRLTVTKQ